MEVQQIPPSRDPSLVFMSILCELVKEYKEYGESNEDAMRIAARITDILHSIKAMVNSINYSGDFWRIILPEIMFLFDSPLVVIKVSRNGKTEKWMNAWPQEYNTLVDVAEIEKYSSECILKKCIRRFSLDEYGSPLRSLEIIKRNYKSAVEQLSKEGKEASNERTNIIEVLSLSNLDGTDYPIRRVRLLSTKQLVIVPMVEDFIEGGTRCRMQGTVEIYLDDCAREAKEGSNVGSQLMRGFLHKEENDKIIISVFSIICGLKMEFSSGKGEIVNYSLLDNKERFLSFIGDIDGKPSGEQIKDFAEQFREEFVFVNKSIAEIWSKAVKRIETLKDNKDKSETERDDYLSFTIGEYYRGKIVYSYFLPSVDNGQSRSPLRDALNDMHSFADFKKLWMEPFDQEKSVMGYISYAGGFPEYVVDIDDDIRVAAYQPRVGKEELEMIGFPPAFALEIPILSKVADEASRQYELRVAMVYFSKDPIPLKMRWFLYDLAHDSKEAIRTALSNQEEYRKRALEQRAEDWMDMAAGLSHSMTNYALGITGPLGNLINTFSKAYSDTEWRKIEEYVKSRNIGKKVNVAEILTGIDSSEKFRGEIDKVVATIGFANDKARVH